MSENEVITSEDVGTISAAALTSVSSAAMNPNKELCRAMEEAMAQSIKDWLAEGRAIEEDPTALKERMMLARVKARDNFQFSQQFVQTA